MITSVIGLEVRMDDRLAELRHEIDEIMSTGPIGRWTHPPTTFPMISQTVVFNADGGGLMTYCSGMTGTTRQEFEWSMECPGRLVMRCGRWEQDLPSDGAGEHTDQDEDISEDQEEDIFDASGTFDIEIKIKETEFGQWPVMTNRSGDVFGTFYCALSRADPPLVLPLRLPVIRPKPTWLSRIRDVVARYR
jgi:hypothetical protein